jgi:HK97 family phage major capsid protein
MTLAQLQQRLGELRTQATDALDEIRANTDESRAAELEQRHDAIMADYDRVVGSIEREERHARMVGQIEERAQRQREQRRPGTEGEQRGGDNGTTELTYRDAFYAYVRAEGQVGALSQEERAVLARGYQAVESRAQTTANAAGGYTVPTELQAELIKAMKLWGPMYDGAVTRELVTTGGNPMPFPTVDDTANTGSATTQGQTLTDDGSGDVVFGQRQLDAFAFATPWIRVSKELADDSALVIESVLADLLGERLGRLANTQLTTGSGSSAPNGIVTATTAGKITASATAFTADEIIDFEHSIDAAYRMAPSFGFMFHDQVLAAIRKLKDGQGNYLWTAGNYQNGVPATINGRRYWINNAMSSAFTTGQKLIVGGDFKKYFVRKVGAPLLGAIQDKDFWPGFGVAGWIRFDGDLMDTGAVKHLKLA